MRDDVDDLAEAWGALIAFIPWWSMASIALAVLALLLIFVFGPRRFQPSRPAAMDFGFNPSLYHSGVRRRVWWEKLIGRPSRRPKQKPRPTTVRSVRMQESEVDILL